MTDEFSSPILPSFIDDKELLQTIEYSVLIATGFLVGYGQVAVEYACKKYAYQCSWKEKKGQAFVRRIENIVPFAGLCGIAGSAGIFWGYY